jgi:hypothetical protein
MLEENAPAAVVGSGPTSPPPKDAAHCAQNLAASGFSEPHFGHGRVNGVAHWIQNFASCGFSAEQFWQRIDLPATQPTTVSLIIRRPGTN